MIHTHIARNCTVSLLRCEQTRSAILWGQNFDSIKMACRRSSRRNSKIMQFRGMFMWIIIFFFQIIFLFIMHFYNKQFQRPTRPIQGRLESSPNPVPSLENCSAFRPQPVPHAGQRPLISLGAFV